MSAAQSIIQSQFDGQLVDNCVTWVADGDFFSDAELGAIAQAAAEGWGTNLCPLLVPGYQLTGALATDLQTGHTASYTHVVNGSLSNPPLPAFAVAKVAISTAVPKVRGRTGISGLPSNCLSSNSNFLNPANRAEFEDAWHNFVNHVEGATGVGGAHLGVVSTISGNAPRPTPLEVAATGSGVLGKLGTRRSRLN